MVYRPPVSWRYDLRSSPKGALYFIIKKGDREIGERAFFLIPPPLVLVHGILSGPATWKNFVKRITDAKYIVSTQMVDYSRTTTSGFDVNYTPLREQVYKIIQEYRDFRIAATRTDVLCHSMGGALARWWFMDMEGSIYRGPRLGAYKDNLTFDKVLMYSGNESYKRGDNYGLGSVRRFITVGTPHLGSYWANVVAEASHTVLGSDALSGYMLAKGIKDIDAISDLAVDSSAMKILKVSGTNTQSRYTGGNLGLIEIPPNSIDDPLLELYYIFLSHVVDRLGDGIVGMESQGNGVVPASKNTIDNVFHTQETASEGLFNIVIRLLRDDMLREFDASTNTFVR